MLRFVWEGTMSGAWKERERLVASWFGSYRNPLSGRNNVADDGSRRLGDVIHPIAVIEVKRRKANSTLFRAKETRELAKDKPWVHVEFATGQPGIVAFVMDFKMADNVARYLNSSWFTDVDQPSSTHRQPPPPPPQSTP